MQLDPSLLRQCWFLAGPTACGKTAVGIELAERLNAEVLSLDSMAVYRGMNIGTAKPTPEERTRVPHHLVDLIDPHEEYSTARYLQDADIACRAILERGRIPLFVGGTGLYLRAVLRGLFEAAPKDPEFRRQLERDAAETSPEHVLERLRQVDPKSAERLHPNDLRRVIRALEVHHTTGRRASELQVQQPLPLDRRPRNVYWLHPPRDWLYERIERRVDRMIAAGLVDEVRNLLADPLGLGHTARQALGYREIIDCLERNGELEEAIAQIKLKTRQFAKRQHTWFRNLQECHAVEIAGTESAAEIAERILAAARTCEATHEP
jgi:tRNA dimethylallyltransferase